MSENSALVAEIATREADYFRAWTAVESAALKVPEAEMVVLDRKIRRLLKNRPTDWGARLSAAVSAWETKVEAAYLDLLQARQHTNPEPRRASPSHPRRLKDPTHQPEG